MRGTAPSSSLGSLALQPRRSPWWAAHARLLGASLLGASLLGACGGDDAPSDDGSCSVPASTQSTAACVACTERSCAVEYQGFCASGCDARDTSATCQQAIAKVVSCALDSCSAECASIAGGGGAGGGEGSAAPGFSCYVEDQGLCSAAAVSDATRDDYVRACMDVGGLVAEICPTERLIGCCSYAGGTQTCVYETTAPPLDRDSCGQSGGRWGEPE